jgi:hypothetical protein
MRLTFMCMFADERVARSALFILGARKVTPSLTMKNRGTPGSTRSEQRMGQRRPRHVDGFSVTGDWHPGRIA